MNSYVKWTVNKGRDGKAALVEREMKTQYILRELMVGSDNVFVSGKGVRYGKGERAFVPCTKEEAESVVLEAQRQYEGKMAELRAKQNEGERRLQAFLVENRAWIEQALNDEDDGMVNLRFAGAEGAVRMTVILPSETGQYLNVSWYVKDARRNRWEGPASTTVQVETDYLLDGDGKIVGEYEIEDARLRAIARMVMREMRID